MPETLLDALVVAAAVGCALVAGTFFAFSVFVMRALGELPAAQGIAAMQAINRVILRTAFIPVFLGTAALAAALAAWGLVAIAAPGAPWLVAGGLLYAVGSFGVTLRCNVPRNRALDRLAPADPASVAPWRDYVTVWTRWNHLRTLASAIAAICFTLT